MWGRDLSRAWATRARCGCFVRNRKVATLPGQLNRMDFEVQPGVREWNLRGATQNSFRSRARRVRHIAILSGKAK
eukprot:6864320-Pyramimonas_sp.AAC.1